MAQQMRFPTLAQQIRNVQTAALSLGYLYERQSTIRWLVATCAIVVYKIIRSEDSFTKRAALNNKVLI